MHGVDQFVLGPAGVDRDASDGDNPAIRGKCLMLDLTRLGAVECISKVTSHVGGQPWINTATDFLIRGKGEA